MCAHCRSTTFITLYIVRNVSATQTKYMTLIVGDLYYILSYVEVNHIEGLAQGNMVQQRLTSLQVFGGDHLFSSSG